MAAAPAAAGAAIGVAIVLPVVVPSAEFGAPSVAGLLLFAGIGGAFAGRGFARGLVDDRWTTLALLGLWLAAAVAIGVVNPYGDRDWLVPVCGLFVGLFGGHLVTLLVALATSVVALWVFVGAGPAFLVAWAVGGAARALARRLRN